jgi:Ca2+-binding RTX toxin-like protein
VVATDVSVWVNFTSLHGIEEIQGGGSDDTQIVGTAGDDVIDLRDIVVSHIRWVTGDTGNDIIYGSQTADNLIGAQGNDTLYGGAGNDRFTYYASAGTDAVDGGDGYDTLVAGYEVATIGISSMTSIEAITAENVNGVNRTGIAFTDGADNFDFSGIAVSGITFIDMKAGDDIFVGSSWSERIIGSLGHDTMTGGGGADNFDFTDVSEIDSDVITDFVSGVDFIGLANIDARTNLNDNQSFTLIGTAAFTGVSGQLRYEVVGGNSTLSGDVNGDGLADFYIHVLGVTSFSAGDFFL